MTKHRKKSRGKGRSTARRKSHSLPGRALRILGKADELIHEGEEETALDLVQALDKQYPGRVQVLKWLSDFYYNKGMKLSHLDTLMRLVKVDPLDPNTQIILCSAYMANNHPTLARQQAQHIITHWPQHDAIHEIKDILAMLEGALLEMIKKTGYSISSAEKLYVAEEYARFYLAKKNIKESRRYLQQALTLIPEYIPALNNLSLTYWEEGDLVEANRISRIVLTKDPDNYHALGNLMRYLYILGENQELPTLQIRLLAAEDDLLTIFLKQMEILSYLGEAEAILSVYDKALASKRLTDLHHSEANLHHWAAVAYVLTGNEKSARLAWKRALKVNPNHTLSEGNQLDLARPIGEREGPWAFRAVDWIPSKLLVQVKGLFESSTHRSKQKGKLGKRFMQKFPIWERLLEILLWRGDPAGRELALQIISYYATPALQKTLLDFIASKQGTDTSRLTAFQIAVEANLITDHIEAWQEGKLIPLYAINFEIYYEPVDDDFSEEVHDLFTKGTEALYDEDYATAEASFLQAIELEPTMPSIQNNLAALYLQSGQKNKGERLMYQIHENFPDYFFGRANIAQVKAREKDIEGARALIAPLMGEKRLHITEFTALAQAQIEIALQDDLKEHAQRWLEMLEDIDPDFHQLDYWHQRLRPSGWISKLQDFLAN